MKLYYDKRAKDPIYYVQEGMRINGKATTRNVKVIGKHSLLLEITDDPLAYAKAEIEKMNKEQHVGKDKFEIALDYNQGLEESHTNVSKSTSSNIGYFYLQYIYHQLKLDCFFKDITKKRKNTFNCNDINRFLTFARILDPDSKYGTYDKLDTYFEKPDFDYQHIMRFMDILEENSDEYLKYLFTASNNVQKRNTAVMYYDCTNYYFEIESPDEQVIDEVTGEMIQGLRQFGISKEHRPNPIVEMGLIMDARGIPVSMCIHPGNTNEQITAIPLEEEVIKMIGNGKFIYCSDAGLGSYNIRKFNSMGGRAFIVTQSIKKLSTNLMESVFNDCDYKLLSTNEPVSLNHMMTFDRKDNTNIDLYNDRAYKIIRADKALDLGLYEYKTCKNGSKRKVKAKGNLSQRVIITFSRKLMEYQRFIRNRQVERTKRLLNNNDPEQIKKGPNDLRRFCKNVGSSKYVLDTEKIKEEEKYDGFYAIATNLEDDAKDILDVAAGRYKIEESFRIMKTHFDAHPIFHRKGERIKAHFYICFTALLVYRLLECKLQDNNTPVTTDNLIDSLKNMNVAKIDKFNYMATYTTSTTLSALEEITGLGLNRKYYKPNVLAKKIKQISK